MFQIQYENDADNTPKVWLLLRVLTLSQGLFSGSCSATDKVHKNVERSTARKVQRDVPQNRLSHPV